MSFNISNYITSPISAITSNINFLLFSQIGSQVIQLFGVIDQIPEEQHLLSAGTSDYPIETGATLTDHVFIKPKQLRIIGYVSSIMTSKFSTLITSYRDREAWERIILQIGQREVVSVITTLTLYNNMIITDVQTRKSNQIGQGSLIFTMSFKESLIANTQQTKLPKTQVTGAATNKTGLVNDGAKQSESWLGSITGL